MRADLEAFHDQPLGLGNFREHLAVRVGKAYSGERLHLQKQFTQGVLFREFRLPHFPAQGADDDERDELDKEPAVHGRGTVGAKMLHVRTASLVRYTLSA